MSYELTKLSQQSQMYLGFIISNQVSRSKAISLVVARILASDLQLPEECADCGMFYNTQHRISVEHKLNRLNNLVILDVQTVLDYTKKFYQFRYESMYPSAHLLAVSKESAVLDFFKISKIFDCETIKVIEENYVTINEGNMRFKQIISELLLENKDGDQ